MTGDWKVVDAELRRLSRLRAAHDFEEGRWLLAARRTAAHSKLGFASLAAYIESVLGHDAHTVNERVRVAEALEGLPMTAAALRDGRRCWSAIRELTRVAVPETEGEWLSDTQGKTTRQVEEMVAGLQLGDRPTDTPDPSQKTRTLRLKVGPETFAVFREAVGKLRREVDPRLSDEDALLEMARRILGGTQDEGRSPFQMVVTACDGCKRAWQGGRGERVEVDAEVVERASCDSQWVSADPKPGTVKRAVQSIPPALRRSIVHRHHGRCAVSGCRNTSDLHVHHLHLRSEGGTHDPEKMVLICGAHHRLVHRGFLIIEGTYTKGFSFRHADGTVYGSPPTPATVEASTEAFAALRALGFKEGEARSALTAAQSHVGPDASAEDLVRAALKYRQNPARSYVLHAREAMTPYGAVESAPAATIASCVAQPYTLPTSPVSFTGPTRDAEVPGVPSASMG